MTSPIPSRGGNPNRFDIPTNAAQNNRFPHQSPISVELSQAAGAQYHVFRKDIDDDAAGKTFTIPGNPPQVKTVTWLNNFGLKPKGSNDFAGSVTQYTIHIPRVNGATLYVYYDGSQAQGLDFSTNPNDQNDIVAQLDRGDPPIGWI